MSKINCYACRDEGLEGGCPKCGKELILSVQIKKKDVNSKDLLDLHIPLHYKTNRWKKEILQQDYIDLFENVPTFDHYTNQLAGALGILASGGMLTNSAMVISPPGYSKTTWAYSCILEAYEHGYKAVPLIDTTQLKRMMFTSSENPDWFVNYLGLSVDKYINADLLMLSVAKGPEFMYAYEVIINVLDVRGRLDKPTVVLSDYTVDELCSEDRRRYLYRLMEKSTSSYVNPYRYLSVIDFNDMKGERYSENS